MNIEDRLIDDGGTPTPTPQPTPVPSPAPAPRPGPSWWSRIRSEAGMLLMAVMVVWLGGLTVAVVAPHVAPAPAPGPRPGPTPPPLPTPVATNEIHVVYVVDGSKVTPVEAAIRSSTAIREACAALKAHYETYQEGQMELIDAKLEPIVQATGLPCAIFLEAVPDPTGRPPTGRVVAKIKAPDEQAIVSTLKHLRGQ
jgi:hypothetical protein